MRDAETTAVIAKTPLLKSKPSRANSGPQKDGNAGVGNDDKQTNLTELYPDWKCQSSDATIHLRDQAVATSSPCGTMFGEGPAGHTLDLKTRWWPRPICEGSVSFIDPLQPRMGNADLSALVNRFTDAAVRSMDKGGNMLVA